MGGFVGGTVSEISGGNFEEGFATGLTVAALNHTLHSGAKLFTDPKKNTGYYKARFSEYAGYNKNYSGLTWKTPVGGTLVYLGQPYVSKTMITQAFGKAPRASLGTSYASKFLSKHLDYKLPFRLYTPSGGVSGTPFRFTKTINLGRFLGRWTPFVGWGLLIYDVGNYFYQGIQEIKGGALLDHRYYQTPAVRKATRYGEREP